jgi:hypothetical protein
MKRTGDGQKFASDHQVPYYSTPAQSPDSLQEGLSPPSPQFQCWEQLLVMYLQTFVRDMSPEIVPRAFQH